MVQPPFNSVATSGVYPGRYGMSTGHKIACLLWRIPLSTYSVHSVLFRLSILLLCMHTRRTTHLYALLDCLLSCTKKEGNNYVLMPVACWWLKSWLLINVQCFHRPFISKCVVDGWNVNLKVCSMYHVYIVHFTIEWNGVCLGEWKSVGSLGACTCLHYK
jgi:hypothetical protein